MPDRDPMTVALAAPSCPVRRRPLLLALGYGLFALGFVGLFLPLLPTTIFWIMAAACFARSSPAMYARIVSWPKAGPVVADFVERGTIARPGKLAALAGMAAGVLVVILTVRAGWPMALALSGIAFAAAYVATRPERTSDTV